MFGSPNLAPLPPPSGQVSVEPGASFADRAIPLAALLKLAESAGLVDAAAAALAADQRPSRRRESIVLSRGTPRIVGPAAGGDFTDGRTADADLRRDGALGERAFAQ